jgi:hypothetical protein
MLQKNFSEMELLDRNSNKLNSFVPHLTMKDFATVVVKMVVSIAGIKEENSDLSSKLTLLNAQQL